MTLNALFLHFFAKKFGHVKKKQYFCTRFWKTKLIVPWFSGLRKRARSLQIESPLGRNASDSDIPTEEREHGVALYEGFTRSRASRSSREGAVVQLVRIPACHAVGREFESRPHRKCWKSTSYAWDALKSAQNLHKWPLNNVVWPKNRHIKQ